MLEYHLGVRPQSFYDAKRKSVELLQEKTRVETERSALAAVRESYQKRKATKQVDLDPAVFRKEIEELIEQYNKILRTSAADSARAQASQERAP
jgi:hypothetical protein